MFSPSANVIHLFSFAMPESTYTDQDIAAILKRAAELQATADRTADLRPGLTLKELEHVAADAGLDPRFVRQAAAEREGTQRPSLRRASERNATHIFSERHVAGALTDESWEDVVLELRHRFDTDLGASMMGSSHYGQSTTESFGRSREWRHTSLSGIETRVMVRPREEVVDVRLSQRVGLSGPTTEATMYGGVVALLLGLVVGAWTGSTGLGLATFVLAWVAAFPVIRYLDLAWRAKKHTELDDLADTVARLAVVPTVQPPMPQATGISASATTKPAASTPPLVLPEEEQPVQDDTPVDTRSRTR